MAGFAKTGRGERRKDCTNMSAGQKYSFDREKSQQKESRSLGEKIQQAKYLLRAYENPPRGEIQDENLLKD
jgi:hypothetical protein